jgi:hypothetical protein|tara:strand:+ start:40 stop:651 length:612 start_codon:yes stop_codon:yes gene_type:complete
MPITFNGNGTITGISAGGLPDGCIVDADITGVAASKLSGALPAISGAALTNLPGGGKLLQVVTAETVTQVSNSSYNLASIGLAASITPSATTSKIFISASANVSVYGDSYSTSGRQIYLVLKRGDQTGTTLQQTIVGDEESGNSATTPKLNRVCPLIYLDSPNTTSSTTYTVAFGKYSNNVVMYAQRDNNNFKSTITLMEIGA